MRFAGLLSEEDDEPAENNSDPLDTLDNGNGSEALHKELRVGSVVQWSSQGVLQFPKPLPIARIDEHAGERYAYFEGKGHAPMSQLALADSAAQPVELKLMAPAAPQSPPPAEKPSYDGPCIQFPLPNNNSIEIRLKRPVSKSDFERIKKLVELSEDSLVADEDDFLN